MSQAVTGADIGASGIRAVRLTQRSGQLELVAGASTDLPLRAGAARGRRDSERVTESPEQLKEIRTNLASLLRRGPFRSGLSVLGLSGSAGLIRYLQVPPVPPWKMEMMMKYEVEEQSAAQEPSAFDYRILDLPDVGGQLTVMLAMVQERQLRGRIDTARRAGLPRGDVDLNTLGLFNAYLHGHGAELDRTVLLVDIGADTLGVVVVRDGLLYFARSVPGGGARFSAAVAEAAGLSSEEAEVLKREKGCILPPGEGEDADLPAVQKKISAALAREMGALAGGIESSLMYCRAQTKQAKLRPEEMLVTGGGSMLPGLTEALARRMRMRVAPLEPFRQVSLGGLSAKDVSEISAEAPRYSVALGLAASRLVPGSVTMSMVPEDVKARRRFLDAGLWMWYAAGCIFLVAGLLTWVTGRNRSVYADEHGRIEKLLADAKKDRKQFGTLFKDTRQRRDEVKALEERVHSGRDIVQVLSLLKKCTGGKFEKSVVLVETGNRPPAVAGPAAKERTQSLQQARRVYIRGFATAKVKGSVTEDAARAAAARAVMDLIEDYRLALQRKGSQLKIVSEVIPRFMQYDPDKKFLEEKGKARHEFVLEIVLAQPGAGAVDRLASGSRKR